MGIRTLLNILGPLTNPAGATIQVLGVFDAGLTELLAKVLIHLGTQHCFIVHGMDGLDEITVTDRTRISEGKAGVVSSYIDRSRRVRRGTARVTKIWPAGRRMTTRRLSGRFFLGKKAPNEMSYA